MGKRIIPLCSQILLSPASTWMKASGHGRNMTERLDKSRWPLVATFVFLSTSDPFACHSGGDFLILVACFWYSLGISAGIIKALENVYEGSLELVFYVNTEPVGRS